MSERRELRLTLTVASMNSRLATSDVREVQRIDVILQRGQIRKPRILELIAHQPIRNQEVGKLIRSRNSRRQSGFNPRTKQLESVYQASRAVKPISSFRLGTAHHTAQRTEVLRRRYFLKSLQAALGSMSSHILNCASKSMNQLQVMDRNDTSHHI